MDLRSSNIANIEYPKLCCPVLSFIIVFLSLFFNCCKYSWKIELTPAYEQFLEGFLHYQGKSKGDSPQVFGNTSHRLNILCSSR